MPLSIGFGIKKQKSFCLNILTLAYAIMRKMETKLLLTILIPLIFSIGLGWGWKMDKHRNIQLGARTLTLWCALVIPVLLFWNWIWEHPWVIGYSILPFIIVGIYFFREELPARLVRKQKLKQLEQTKTILAPLEWDITNANNAISAGNVQQWLNCFVEHVYWVAFDKPTFTYVVIQLNVISRFIYDLIFPNPEQVSIILIVKGDIENENIKIADKATLVESQSSWNTIEDPRKANFTDKVEALRSNTKYLRFKLEDIGARGRIEAFHSGKSEIQIELKLNWKLKVAHSNKELTYFLNLNARCQVEQLKTLD